MKKWIVLLLAFCLLGCGEHEGEKRTSLKISAKKMWGNPFIVFDVEGTEVVISLAQFGALAEMSMPTKYCGEYYIKETQRYWDGHEATTEEWVWRHYKNSEKDDEVNGFIKIDDKWLKKDRVIDYSEVPDKYQSLRDKIEKQVKREEKGEVMGAYICAICDVMFDSHEVPCYEYKEKELICENCKIELKEEIQKDEGR